MRLVHLRASSSGGGGKKGGGEFGENVLGKVFASVTREMYEKVMQTVYSPIYRGKRFSAL